MARYDDIYRYFIKTMSINDVKAYNENVKHIISFEMSDFKSSSQEDKNLSAISFFQLISDQMLGEFMYFTNKDHKYHNRSLCDYIALKSIEMLLLYAAKDKTNRYGIQPDYIGRSFLSLMACNQFTVPEKVYDEIVSSVIDGTIKSAMTYDDGSFDTQKLFVLLMEMLASEQKQTIDWAAAGIPVERFYDDFVKEALYSTDEKKVSEWLNALCDQHLKWCSRFPEVAKEEYGYDIPVEMHLWPFEYHAVKNLRLKHGLDTPEINHPLMKAAFSAIPVPDFKQWEKPQWFSEICEELFRLNPEIVFIQKEFQGS